MIQETETIASSTSEPPVTRAEQAEISSAKKRMNIPLNLQNWKDLPEDHVEQLQWFHQYILIENLGYDDVKEAIDYDNSTVFRVLKGTYEGNWSNVISKIKSWRKLVASQARLQKSFFVKNRVAEQIDWILAYTLARSGACLILGESGIGKSEGTFAWAKDNNHGRSVVVECLPTGGAKGLLRQIAEKVGVNKNLNQNQMMESVIRAFNKGRILILDEIQHHLPTTRTTRPLALEMVRRIHDLSGCGLALIGTVRVEEEMKGSRYMFEQIIGRTGKPFYLQTDLEEQDVFGIVKQFIKKPTDRFMDVMVNWSNDRDSGRLRYMVDMLTFASSIAHDQKKPMTEDMVLASHAMREKKSKKGGSHAK